MRMKLLIGLVFFAASAVPAGAADTPLGGQAVDSAQQGQPPRPDYHCPTTSYLNCMPPITEARRQACSKDYIAWVQKNCPKTQVVY